MAGSSTGITKQEARQVRYPTLIGDVAITNKMTSAATEIIELSSVAEKITFQSSGNLAYTWAVSANGIDFNTATSATANTLNMYSTTLAKVVKIVWVSGSGRVSVLAR